MTTPLMLAIQAAALWSGLLILMMLVLSGVVVSGRRKHMISLGDGGNADLMAASRAFGNLVEYATPGMIAMLLLAAVGAPAWMVHGVGATLLIGRICHALGCCSRPGAARPGGGDAADLGGAADGRRGADRLRRRLGQSTFSRWNLRSSFRAERSEEPGTQGCGAVAGRSRRRIASLLGSGFVLWTPRNDGLGLNVD
ncbi:MAPEG family protein [Brevundimonas sp.]|uniref:MAPEG family protein n=1 Tax=Brevundimonas sp. TaxID=1871086 RepID=UPI003B003D4A